MFRTFITCLSLLAAVGAAAAGLLTQEWRQQTFLTQGRVEFSGAADRLEVSIATQEKEKCIFSFWQPVSIDPTSRLIARFQARTDSAGAKFLLVCVSSSPGCNLPCARGGTWLTAEWADYEIPIPLAGMNRESVFEFVWEGMFQKGEILEIRNLSLTPDAATPPAQVFVTEPATRLIVPEQTGTRLAGTLAPRRDLANGSWTLQVADAAGNIPLTASGQLDYPSTAWQIDAAGLPDGKYELRFACAGTDGADAGTAVSTFIKAPPEALGSHVRDNTLYYHGEPFVPIGIFHAGLWNMDRANQVTAQLGGTPQSYDEMFAGLRDHGFNTLLAESGMNGEELERWSALAARYDLAVVPRIHSIAAPAFGRIDNLLGWYGADEASGGLPAENGRRMYAELKSLEPYSTVFSANYEPTHVEETRATGNLFDVVLFDRYVVRAADTDFRELDAAMKRLAGIVAERPELVFGITPQCFIYCGPEPTPEQLRLQVYLGVIDGARAFVYYSYNENYGVEDFDFSLEEFPLTATGMSLNPARKKWWLPESRLWEACAQINAELVELNDLILHGRESRALTIASPEISWTCRDAGGEAWFIAANLTAHPVSAAGNAAAPRPLTGRFGTGDLALEAGNFTLDFAPYEIKVFNFEDK